MTLRRCFSLLGGSGRRENVAWGRVSARLTLLLHCVSELAGNLLPAVSFLSLSLCLLACLLGFVQSGVSPLTPSHTPDAGILRCNAAEKGRKLPPKSLCPLLRLFQQGLVGPPSMSLKGGGPGAPQLGLDGTHWAFLYSKVVGDIRGLSQAGKVWASWLLLMTVISLLPGPFCDG